MNRLIGILAFGCVGMAFTLGYLLAAEPPEIVAARAEKLRAGAALERERVAQAALETHAREAALPARIAGLRLAALGGGMALAVALIGGSLAFATWATTRARTLYPDARGQWPILVHLAWDGSMVVADTSRLPAPVMRVERDGTLRLPYRRTEAAALELAGRAQQAAALVATARASASAGVAHSVIEAAGQAVRHATAAPVEAERIVFRNTPMVARKLRADDRNKNLGLMIRGASSLSLARRVWLPQIGREGYDECIRALVGADCVSPLGRSWQLSVTADEACARLGVN